MKLIKACFLSYVSLLQGLHAKERALLLAALAAWHETLILVPTCPLSTNVHLRKATDAASERKVFLLAAGNVWKLGLWNSHLAGLCISCWMICRVF